MGFGMSTVSADPDNDAIREIRDYAKAQNRQTNWIIALTIFLAILAGIQTILLIRQYF